MKTERNLLIPLGDGASAAADLYLPDDQSPVPAVLSYYPYRKDDFIGAEATWMVQYFAQCGYASLLVDLRGLGSSTGTAWGSLDPREADDGAAIVDWVGEQDWCDGNVGMWGVSYGAITSFQTAARRPRHLKAIAPIMGGLDPYGDWNYPGGCMNCMGAGIWGGSMLAMHLMPPMHQDPDGHWWDIWQQRLEHGEPYLMPWREHQARDEFWRTREIEASSIDTPTFLIGGWRDIFPEAMVRAYERIDAPRRLLMGPWPHTPPDLDPIVPIDYLREVRSWWDRWLRDTVSEPAPPPVSIYVQGAGVWRHADRWPMAEAEKTLYLGASGGLLASPPTSGGTVEYAADPTVGMAAGLWDPLGLGVGLPLDQAGDDVRSLTFTGEPLQGALEIVGSPVARVFVAADLRSELNLVVKLCDVAPNGSSTLITTGWLGGSELIAQASLDRGPDEPQALSVQLWATAYEVAPGHRLRVSVACGDFPRIWPTATNHRIRVAVGDPHLSELRLPVVTAPRDSGHVLPSPDPTIDTLPLVLDFAPRWTIARDHASGLASVTAGMRFAATTPSGSGRLEMDQTATAVVPADRPDGAHIEEATSAALETPSGSTVEVRTTTWQSARHVALTGEVDVDGRRFFSRRWEA